MASRRDSKGRPVVAVTGMGIVTPLGTGKADNWKKLTAGESGIRTITRFPTDGLRTTISGAVDHVFEAGMHSAELSEKLARLAGEEAIEESGIGSKGRFPGPFFLAFPPIEIEWPQRFALANASGANEKIEYGDPARRMRRSACDRRRRVDHRGIGRALLAFVGALDQQCVPARCVTPILEKPRRFRAGRRCGGARS
jgi:hypothetical protein